MSIKLIEIILVCLVVFIQIWVFTRTLAQIVVFRRIIPPVDDLKISRLVVATSDLANVPPKELLAKVRVKINDSTAGSTEDTQQKAEVNIIECKGETNYVFDNILSSINNYLIRNSGAASDFNLLKDIVVRNTDAIEEDINLSIAIPLYLGLAGTMFGIVIGLFNIPDLNLVIDTTIKDTKFNDGISLLIGGVKIAMIASFFGLVLTIINSGWTFKGARTLVEARKNEFYTFIQIELLPIINQGLAATLESLQRNLLQFNKEFSVNLNGVSGIFDSSIVALQAQKELLDSLDNTKVAEITKYNINVLQQMQISIAEFEKFNIYLNNINSIVANSQQLTEKINELIGRTDNFKAIADKLDMRLTESQALLEFLANHFDNLEKHKEYVSNTVAQVGHSISDAFKELKEHIYNSSKAVKDFTVDEVDILKTALTERNAVMKNTVFDVDNTISEAVNQLREHTQSSIERVKKYTLEEAEALKTAMAGNRTGFNNLEHLSSINQEVAQFKNSSFYQGEKLSQQLEDLNKNMNKSILLLEEMGKKNKAPGKVSVTNSLKRFFFKEEIKK